MPAKSFFNRAMRSFMARARLDVLMKKLDYHNVHGLDYLVVSAHKKLDVRVNENFRGLAARVIEHGKTMLYYDRLYTIYQIMAYLKNRFSEAGDRGFAEVGVYKGGTSYYIASLIQELHFDNASLHCFDTFQGFDQSDFLQQDTWRNELFHDTNYEDVKKYLGAFSNVYTHQGRFQDTCAGISANNFIFAHIDVDIYHPTVFCLDFFHDRLEPNGVILVDDYGVKTAPGLKKAVDEFSAKHPEYFFFHLFTGQCLLIRTGSHSCLPL